MAHGQGPQLSLDVAGYGWSSWHVKHALLSPRLTPAWAAAHRAVWQGYGIHDDLLVSSAERPIISSRTPPKSALETEPRGAQTQHLLAHVDGSLRFQLQVNPILAGRQESILDNKQTISHTVVAGEEPKTQLSIPLDHLHQHQPSRRAQSLDLSFDNKTTPGSTRDF